MLIRQRLSPRTTVAVSIAATTTADASFTVVAAGSGVEALGVSVAAATSATFGAKSNFTSARDKTLPVAASTSSTRTLYVPGVIPFVTFSDHFPSAPTCAVSR